MTELRGGLIGCGHFAQTHLQAWQTVDGARLAAVCDLDDGRARSAAEAFGIERVHTSAQDMLDAGGLDFVDVVTQPATHAPLVELAAERGVPVICQKPLAPDLPTAERMVAACRSAGVPFMVHENFRWQTPMRAVRDAAEAIGPLFFGRLTFRSGFDVYAAQPYLATDDRFIIYDLGVHLLDLARFFFGEIRRLYAHTQRVNPHIRAEDVATILLETADGATCVVELSYATTPEEELFPQTLVHLEGMNGAVTLGPNYALTVTGPDGVAHRSVPPKSYAWTTPSRAVIESSAVAIQQHWVDCLRDGRTPETSGADNLRTLELVFGAYASADEHAVYELEDRE